MSLRATIEELCLSKLGRLPDLDNPTGFNDKIQWLKLHDQRAEHVVACDKWAVRDMVARAAGEDVLVPAWVDPEEAELPAVLKCSHDSGSSRVVRSRDDMALALPALRERLKRPYGVDKGEWAYRFVPPRLIAERALEDNTDYKFHCVHGRVAWVQVMWDRREALKEAVFSAEGEPLDIHQDERMIHARRDYPGDTAWSELTALAERLSAGWRYVRVDMYWSGGRAWFGEMTFWPRAGCQNSPADPVLGEMMAIDMSYRFPPIVE